MKQKTEKQFIRAAVQLTFNPSLCSLIAEENKEFFKKGSLVKKVSRADLQDAYRPLMCEILQGKTHQVKLITRWMVNNEPGYESLKDAKIR